MDKPVYVQAASAFLPHAADAARPPVLNADPDVDLRPIIKRVLGQGLRQASHFVELAAIGARQCLERLGRVPEAQMALYLGTALGEVRKTEALFRQVLPPGPGIAAPFDFINATANMAAFYVARAAGVSARNLTVTQGRVSFEAALALAVDDVRARAVPAALVGGVDENYFPRAEFIRRWALRDEEIMGEGSAWLYLSPQRSGALAEIVSVGIVPAGKSDVSAWARAVVDSTSMPSIVVCGINITDAERDALARALPNATWCEYGKYCGSYATAAGYGMASTLTSPATALSLHINRDADGATALIAWRAA